MLMQTVTVRAPTNIALIKYWGKRDVALNLPLNGSISLTLDVNLLNATTTVMRSSKFESDRFWLNGREQPISGRLAKVINYVRGGETTEKVHIASENNFPTKAGLASSAAGLCAFASGLCAVYGKYQNQTDDGQDLHGSMAKRARQNDDHNQLLDLCDIKLDNQIVGIAARIGSGSACRSLPGGIVEWERGNRDDGSDSIAHQIDVASEWKSLRMLVLVTDACEKRIGSREAMLRTASTDIDDDENEDGRFLRERVRYVTSKRLPAIRQAIEKHDFSRIAEITMRDSNEFHAVVFADSLPPVSYLTDRSRRIIDAVHAFNAASGATRLAYTFDAGPNAFLLFDKTDSIEVFDFLLDEGILRPCEVVVDKVDRKSVDPNEITVLKTSDDLRDEVVAWSAHAVPAKSGMSNECTVEFAIYTKLGGGPQFLYDESVSLLDQHGMPKHQISTNL